MNSILIPILFWLSIPLSLIFSIMGVHRGNYVLILFGAFLFLPISYYLNGSPSANGFAIFLPLFQVGSAAAVRENNKSWAWILLAPPLFLVLWFVFAIAFYHLFQ